VTDNPTFVYKYLTADRALEIIRRLQIRFSQASVLNDAFEFRPPLSGMGTRNDIECGVRERLLARLPEIMVNLTARHGSARAVELFDELVSIGADDVGTHENYDRSVRELYQKLDTNFGVLSLTGTPTSPLMWSHYGEGGRGFLVEFDSSHQWFSDKRDQTDSFRHLRKVSYIERTPSYFLHMPDQTALYTKSIEWSYEQEWRIIRNFNDATINAGTDTYGKDVLLFAVPPSSITGIIGGFKVSNTAYDDMAALLNSDPALAHVSLRKADLQDDGSISIVSN
jgi:Protein of unknown function (DUF2971)